MTYLALRRYRNGVTLLENSMALRHLHEQSAARLQLSAPEVTDLSGESPAVKRLYELDDPNTGLFGRQCLLARRLAERGVRFVQLYCGAKNTTAKKIRPNWDSHEDVVRWRQYLRSRERFDKHCSDHQALGGLPDGARRLG
jgi:hypothetical protein